MPQNIAQSILLFAFAVASTSAYAVTRPPQYVALAFDNCTESTRWEELREFGRQMNHDGKPIKFTFFVSGVNFIRDADRMSYQGPGHGAGKANIDFGGSNSDVHDRVVHMHQLYEDGNEIGSHAVGHFNGGNDADGGGNWTVAQWTQELTFFNKLLVSAVNGAGFSDGSKILKELVGFRAPYLSHNDALYTTLSNLHFRYDTSNDDEANVWPKKKGGLWRFNLADLKIAGSGKRTLSMDYNFNVAQTGDNEDPAHYEINKKQTYDTYIQYFLKNYTGNRAPIHIGHHFHGYQGGIYNQALKAFASKVCGLPEVKCITYKELADAMDQIDATTAAAYQAGSFPKASAPF